MARDAGEVEQLADALVEQKAAMAALRAAAGELAVAAAAYRLKRAAFEQAKGAAASVSLRAAGLVQRDTAAIPAPRAERVRALIEAQAEAWLQDAPEGGTP